MASFAFPLSPNQGFGSHWYSDLGPALFNALQAGFKTENDLYNLQNRVRTDPFTVPAQAATADAARLGADRSALMTQNDIDAYNRLLGVRLASDPLATQLPQTPSNMSPVMSALNLQPEPSANYLGQFRQYYGF